MDLSLLLIQVVGVYMVVAGLSVLFNPKKIERAVDEVAHEYLLPFFGGAMSLIVGLLIVLTHNVWDTLATGIVTLVGWAALLKGGLILLMPHHAFADLVEKMGSARFMRVWAGVIVIAGAYLVYVGFFA